MVSTVDKQVGSRLKVWAIALCIGLAAIVTLTITRPAPVASMAMTPLSGLMTLKAMATEATPYTVAIADGKPTIIEFYADWCTTCQSMAPTISALHSQYGTQVNFVMIDIDQPQWAEQIAAYGASGVPQFTLLDSQNQTLDTWVGKVPKPIFTNALKQLVS